MTKTKDKCPYCDGIGETENIFGRALICEKCKGSGEDPGVYHMKLGWMSSREYIDYLTELGMRQRKTQAKLTKAQVSYVKKMKDSGLSAETVSRDLAISITTIENIWNGKSYVNYDK